MDSCLNCNNRCKSTGYCKEISESFNMSTNYDDLFDNGTVDECLDETFEGKIEKYISDVIKKILSSCDGKKISEKNLKSVDFSDEVEEIKEDIVSSVNGCLLTLFKNNLGITSEVKSDCDFKCNKWR